MIRMDVGLYGVAVERIFRLVEGKECDCILDDQRTKCAHTAIVGSQNISHESMPELYHCENCYERMKLMPPFSKYPTLEEIQISEIPVQ